MKFQRFMSEFITNMGKAKVTLKWCYFWKDFAMFIGGIYNNSKSTFWRILQPLGRNYSRGIQPIHLWTPGSSARPAYHFDTIYIHQMSNSNTNAREGLAAGWSLRDFIPFEEFSIGFLLSTDRSVALVASETTWLINHLSHLLRHLRQPSPSGT